MKVQVRVHQQVPCTFRTETCLQLLISKPSCDEAGLTQVISISPVSPNVKWLSSALLIFLDPVYFWLCRLRMADSLISKLDFAGR